MVGIDVRRYYDVVGLLWCTYEKSLERYELCQKVLVEQLTRATRIFRTYPERWVFRNMEQKLLMIFEDSVAAVARQMNGRIRGQTCHWGRVSAILGVV